jgi:Protein of unknown function (DUF1217)
MSGTISSYLPSLFASIISNSTTNAASSLLSILDGTSTQATSASTENPVNALTLAQKDETQEIKATSQQPAVEREIAAFTKAVQTATSPQQLLKNPTVLQVLLTANGLGDQASYTALAQQALLSNVNDPNSLVNKLSNTQWQSVTQTYDFANAGLSIIQNPKVISTIANGYAEVTWLNSLDATTPGLSNALTFIQQASSITSVSQIVSNPLFDTVVNTALGIPEEIAFQSVQAQEQAITAKLDVSKLQDPKYVQQIADQYLIAESNSSQTTTSTPSLEALAVQAQGLVV